MAPSRNTSLLHFLFTLKRWMVRLLKIAVKGYIGCLWLPISNFCHSYLPCACLCDPCWLQYTLFARLLVHTYPHSLTTTTAMILIITATTSALLEYGCSEKVSKWPSICVFRFYLVCTMIWSLWARFAYIFFRLPP